MRRDTLLSNRASVPAVCKRLDHMGVDNVDGVEGE
ncbi:hypothetical protein GEM_4239 [Burkholderia cepacia GG4]|uniref:Uncharacterized protein n=1 Tax=Burkholderia cepacia GG4 TaxID=1009846 RepID=A0A9W3K5C1_BURCE|nr:hypothetical protein GEM_4239 [Burkholderia cepacia GG4]